MVDEEYSLIYLNCRGIAEPIRYMFAIAGVPYQDIRIPFDETFKSLSRIPPEWKDVVPYGKVPMLKIGENKCLVSSKPICRYLAAKFDLVAEDSFDDSKCDELMETLRDYLDSWRKIYHCPEPADLRSEMIAKHMETTTPKYLQEFDKIIANNNGKNLVGSKLTWADIYLSHCITNLQETFQVDLVTKYPALKNLVHSVLNIPAIQEWIQVRPVTVH